MNAPSAADGAPDTGASIPWDLEELSAAPEMHEEARHSDGDVKAVFYAGVPWEGHPTRVFAYYGIPATAGKERVPAMVLVHGGGGSAFIPWVRLWLDRGYAAIAMDTCGCISNGGYENHPRHGHGGPPGWGGFDTVEQPVREQWTYHAVADVILAHSLIRALPGVDAERIGITGVSWGGYLTCIASGVDRRFTFAAPVYGCGFLGENSAWLPEFRQMGRSAACRWLGLWDPSVYLTHTRMPMLWVNGTNDFAYPMDSWQKSYRLPKAPRTLALRVRMPHGHGGPGENPEEIHAMANALFRGGIPLARVTGSGREGGNAWATCESQESVIRAELNYTTNAGPWQNRHWDTVAASRDPRTGTASARLPEGTTVYYFNFIDRRDLVVSSEHEEMPA